jgi:glycosyltransferase involved in cell wall biosynthesis
MLVSLVLPCYNPAPGWEQNVYASYLSVCGRIEAKVEVIIVSDGTSAAVTPGALAYLEEKLPLCRIVKYPENRGKGYAIREGVAVANGDIIIYTDIDFPYTTESIYTIYEGLIKGMYDVGVGVKDRSYYSHVPFLRRVISRFLRFFIKLFLSMPVTDTQCGLKGFNKSVKPLFLKTSIDRYLFDLEFIRNCFKSKKYRIEAIPIALKENIQFRKMNYRILFSEAVNFARLLFKRDAE